MSTMSSRLPESLHERAGESAERERVSINQLVTTALGEKISALLTQKDLEERAARGSRDEYLRILAEVPSAEPDPEDELPEEISGQS